MTQATIKRPINNTEPYFSDGDLEQLAQWININLSQGKILKMKSELQGEYEVLIAEIN